MQLKYHADLCNSCHLCELACSGKHAQAFSKEKARLKITALYNLNGLEKKGQVCNQCFVCVDTCPTAAITVESGCINVNADLCTSCGICSEECPMGVIKVVNNEAAYICDLCGGEPACVSWCSQGAISLIDADKEREVK